MAEKLKCARCGYDGPFRVCGDGKTEGRLYGRLHDGSILCDVCCGDADREDMVRTGRGLLYLTMPAAREALRVYGLSEEFRSYSAGDAYLSNWAGTLRFGLKNGVVRTGRHNLAGIRYDVWFIGPDGKEWHGTQYGDLTQVCHCRRVGK